ncbi:MAG: hypothetical protein Q7K03_11305 [Dehalococcoidia bacterium]|nr:hypothetical protein [Dehalococcoidia bacterium]
MAQGNTEDQITAPGLDMYRTVFTDIWRQKWFEELSVDARYLFLYFWTNPETRPNGVIPTSKRRVMFDTRLDEGRLDAAVADLTPHVRCLWEHGAVWISGFAETQGSGPKWQKAVEKANLATPPEVLDATGMPHQYPSDTPSMTGARGNDTPAIAHPVQEGDTDTPSMPHSPDEKRGIDTPSMGHPPGTGSGTGTAPAPGTENPSGAKAPSGAAPAFSSNSNSPFQEREAALNPEETAPAAAEPFEQDSSPPQADGGGTVPRAMSNRRKTGGNPQVDGVLEAIEGLWGQPIVHWAKEAKEVKAALARGYDPEQVVDCFRAAQESPRWKGRWMPLAYLVEDLGEFVKNGGCPLRKWGQPGKEEAHAESRSKLPTAEEWRARRGRW